MHQVVAQGGVGAKPGVDLTVRLPVPIPVWLVQPEGQGSQYQSAAQDHDAAPKRVWQASQPAVQGQIAVFPPGKAQGSQADGQVGVNIREVGGIQRPNRQPTQQEGQATRQRTAPATLAQHNRQRPAQRQQRQRQGHHVGVQVGVQEGEHGELGDRLNVTRRSDSPAGEPVPITQPKRQ